MSESSVPPPSNRSIQPNLDSISREGSPSTGAPIASPTRAPTTTGRNRRVSSAVVAASSTFTFGLRLGPGLYELGSAADVPDHRGVVLLPESGSDPLVAPDRGRLRYRQ